MVNYHRDFWIRRLEILAPLTKLCSTTAKWHWGKEQQDSVDFMKKNIALEVQLSYPDFNKSFDIYMDASDIQLGAVIAQEGRPIAFHTPESYNLHKKDRP
jgi:pullulanase/glycogen debranching enzyme